MKCPFPGMDPYIERPELWPDFHDSLIAAIRGQLQPLLRPKYAAVTQDRLYLVEHDRNIYPDVAVIRTPVDGQVSNPLQVAVATIDEPAVFPISEELDEIREPYLEIVEAAGERKVVTVIEVVSPANKTRGRGNEKYRQKCREYRAVGANIVEIDLLREGPPVLPISTVRLESLRPWNYLAGISRRHPAQFEIYRIPLASRLPNIRLPLSGADPDVVLDLQSAFERCWEEGPYPALLRYEGPPTGPLTAEEVRWCEKCLAESGIANGGGSR